MMNNVSLALLLTFIIAACATRLFNGYEVTEREGWIFYEVEESLLPALAPGYKDSEAPTTGLSSPVQREFIQQAHDFAESKLKDAGFCPNGFTGPDQVLRNRQTRSLQFRVRCK